MGKGGTVGVAPTLGMQRKGYKSPYAFENNSEMPKDKLLILKTMQMWWRRKWQAAQY